MLSWFLLLFLINLERWGGKVDLFCFIDFLNFLAFFIGALEKTLQNRGFVKDTLNFPALFWET
jgi:hypothetical protein